MVLAVLIVRYLIPWIRSQIENSQYSWICSIIFDAVQYAEQTVHGDGAEKKALVNSLIRDALSKKNINISENQLNAIIESVVFAMNREAA